AELQRNRMLGIIETKQPLAVAMDDRVGDDHFRIEQRLARELSMEKPAVPVSPVDHRRHGKFVVRVASHLGKCRLAERVQRAIQTNSGKVTPRATTRCHLPASRSPPDPSLQEGETPTLP